MGPWSLHQSFLDRAVILGVWREGLLAQKVLLGKTKGYKNHPQLTRFKNTKDPVLYIGTYLYFIYVGDVNRSYNFEIKRMMKYDPNVKKIELTMGQLYFECKHLLKNWGKETRKIKKI